MNQLLQILLMSSIPGLFILVGAVVVCLAIFYKGKGSKLMQSGIAVDGIIDDVIKASASFGFRSNSGGLSFNTGSGVKYSAGNPASASSKASDEIIVTFSTKDNRVIKGSPQRGNAISYDNLYKKGQNVKVYYDPAAPDSFILKAGKVQLAGRIFLAFIGLIFLGIGIVIVMFSR